MRGCLLSVPLMKRLARGGGKGLPRGKGNERRRGFLAERHLQETGKCEGLNAPTQPILHSTVLGLPGAFKGSLLLSIKCAPEAGLWVSADSTSHTP